MTKIQQVIGEAIGEASMCWSERPTGEFDSTRAEALVRKIMDVFCLEIGMTPTRYVEVMTQNYKLRAEIEQLRTLLKQSIGISPLLETLNAKILGDK